MYGIKTRGLSGTFAPIYQELQVERSDPPATSRTMSHPALLGFGSGLDTTEALVSQIPDAIGYPFDVLLDRRQHVGEHRGASRTGDREEIWETGDAETEIGLRTFAPLLLEHLAALAADVDP